MTGAGRDEGCNILKACNIPQIFFHMEDVKLSMATRWKVQLEAPARYCYHGLVLYHQCAREQRSGRLGAAR